MNEAQFTNKQPKKQQNEAESKKLNLTVRSSLIKKKIKNLELKRSTSTLILAERSWKKMQKNSWNEQKKKLN